MIETLVALAIALVVVAALTVSINQIVVVNASTANRSAAIKAVENAVHYISRDARQTQVVTISGPTFPLGLSWRSWSNDVYAVSYFLDGRTLMRRETKNDRNQVDTRIAGDIDTAKPENNTLYWSKGVLTVKVTATVGVFRSASEMRIFEVEARSIQ